MTLLDCRSVKKLSSLQPVLLLQNGIPLEHLFQSKSLQAKNSWKHNISIFRMKSKLAFKKAKELALPALSKEFYFQKIILKKATSQKERHSIRMVLLKASLTTSAASSTEKSKASLKTANRLQLRNMSLES